MGPYLKIQRKRKGGGREEGREGVRRGRKGREIREGERGDRNTPRKT